MLAWVVALVISLVSVNGHVVTSKVRPSPHARAVEVALENDDYFRSSAFAVDANQSVYLVDFRDVPSGFYVLEAIELDEDGKQRQATPQNVLVP